MASRILVLTGQLAAGMGMGMMRMVERGCRRLAAKVFDHDGLGVPASRRHAKHRGSHRAPHGKQDGEQQQEADAQVFHGSSLSQSPGIRPVLKRWRFAS